MLDEENYYDEDDNDEQEEKYAGFSIIDDSGAEVKPDTKKVEEPETPTIASPIPQNEQTIIIDSTTPLLPAIGEELEIKLGENNGEVYFEDEKIGDFKPAFVLKLKADHKGKYVRCIMHSDTSPVMVKLLYSDTAKNGYKKI